MNGCKKGDLAIRVDHISGVLTFDSDVFSSSKAMHTGSAAGSAESDVGSVQRLQHTPAEIARFQVARLAKTLHVTCMYVDPSYNEARLQAKQTAQARAMAGAAQEHEETLARRVVIDKKKEAATDALQRKQREEETRKRIRTQQLQEAEKQRLLDEQRERERKRVKDEQDRIRQEELKKQLEELKTGVKGIDISELDVEELDANRLRAIKLAQLEKEKNELNDRVRTTAKRIDHLERAFRREELKHIPADYEAQKKHDMEQYEKQKAETLKEAKQKHAEAVALKHRLGRLMPQFSSFRKEVSEKRHEEFEKRRKAAEREFEAKKKQRIKEVEDRRRREKQEREEEERIRKEEEERVQREEEERVAREEERRRALAEEKAKREEERAYVCPYHGLCRDHETNFVTANSTNWLLGRSSARKRPKLVALPGRLVVVLPQLQLLPPLLPPVPSPPSLYALDSTSPPARVEVPAGESAWPPRRPLVELPRNPLGKSPSLRAGLVVATFRLTCVPEPRPALDPPRRPVRPLTDLLSATCPARRVSPRSPRPPSRRSRSPPLAASGCRDGSSSKAKGFARMDRYILTSFSSTLGSEQKVTRKFSSVRCIFS